MNKEEKQNVLSNVISIPSKALADYILNEELTIEEMMETGDLEASKRIEILNIIEKEKENLRKLKEEELEKQRQTEKIEWNVISNANNIAEIEAFIQKYPSGRYFKEACDLLVYIQDMQKEKSKILNDIKENSNKYNPDIITEFIKNGVINQEDLLNISIPKIIIDNLKKESKSLLLGEIPDTISNGYTEIYFWGLPGSGKTCALSAILSTGVRMGDIDPQEGLGHHYMSQLSNIFLNKCSVLPPSTHVEYTQYLPFDLFDDNKLKHPIALIELSGEVFRAFYRDQNNLELSEELQATLNRTKEYLNGPNKKIHFFIIDITKDPNKPDNYNTTQQQYLRSLTTYLNSNNVLKHRTDGVYIITTKSDVLSKNESERMDLAIHHLTENYQSFIQSLKSLLVDNGLLNKISDKLPLIPFSLGDVYFNELCYFDDTMSKEVIDLLKKKTSKKEGFWDRFKRKVNI